MKYCEYCKNTICFSGKRMTVKDWNKCPWQLADWKAETYWCLLPRFITRWWYFRKIKQL